MLQVRDDLRLKAMTVSHLYTFLTHLTSPSNLLGLNLKNRRTGDMWAPVSQQLMVEQPSDKTQERFLSNDLVKLYPHYCMSEPQDKKKRDKRITIWQPPCHITLDTSSHPLQKCTHQFPGFWHRCACVTLKLLLLQFKNDFKLRSGAIWVHCTLGWSKWQDFLYCCLSNESFQPWRKTIRYF